MHTAGERHRGALAAGSASIYAVYTPTGLYSGSSASLTQTVTDESAPATTAVTQTTTTGSDGTFDFPNLLPGTYIISEIDPTGYVDAKDTLGSAGGTVGHDTFTNINLGFGIAGSGYDFGWERAPVFASTPIPTAGAGKNYSYDTTATDADGDPLTYSLLEGPAGMTINPTTGQVSWSPGASAVGTYPIELEVSDGRGGLAQQTYTLTVNATSGYLPPYFTSPPVVSATVGTPYPYTATAIDPNGLALTFSVVSGPAGLTINSSTGAITWTPTGNEVGTDAVTLKVADTAGLSATQTYDVVVVSTSDGPPVIISTPTTTISAPPPGYQPGIENNQVFTIPGAGDQPVQATFTEGNSSTAWTDQPGIYEVVDTSGDVVNPAQLYEYDFGTASSPVAAGYTQVDPATTYSASLGYGWTSGTITATDEGTGAALTRDFDATMSGTFAVNLANGSYLVTMIVGDPGTTAHDDMGLSLDGTQIDELSTAAGQETTVTSQVEVQNGQLTLGLTALGSSTVAIEGLEVQGLLAPTDAGYSAAALAPANSQTIFPPGPSPGETATITLVPGQLYAFYMIQNSSVAAFLADNPDDLDQSPRAYFSFSQANPDPSQDDPSIKFNHLHVSYDDAAGTTQFNWEDYPGGGDEDFNDVIFTINELLATGGGYPGYVYPVEAVDPDGDPITYSMPVGPSGATIDPDTGMLDWAPSGPGEYDFTVEAASLGGTDTQSFVLTVESDQEADIYGNVFDDVNGDGAPEAGDSGLAGVTVYLDLNHDGEPDSGDIITTTDDNGDYSFTNLSPGTYTIDEVLPTGWIMTAPTSGTHTVTVNGGQYVINQDFANQAPTPGDQPPVFQTTPPTTATVGQLLEYDALATDADGYPLTYDLPEFPVGMGVDAVTGTLVWTPDADEVGIQNVILRVNDGHGGITLQPMQILVSPADGAPVVTTSPTEPAYAETPYSYQAAAVSPEGYSFTFSLAAGAPSGMTITAAGLLTWPDPTGTTASFTIDVTDSHGGVGTQPVTLAIVPPPGAGEITFKSTPRESVLLGQEYVYQAVAADSDDYTLTFSLPTSGDPAGMTINSTTGVVAWTPTAVGTSSVTIDVRDEYGDTASETFPVTVSTEESDQPPTITAPPPQYAIVGDVYRYNLTATDPTGDPLVWTLESGPTGMVLDPATNSLIWTPTTDQANSAPSVTVEVADDQGGMAGETFPIEVVAADLPPEIKSEPSPNAGVGVAYAYQVVADSPDGFYPLTYSVTTSPANANITINSSTGLLQWPSPTLGSVSITVGVSDLIGLSNTQTYTLTVSSTPPGNPPVITPSVPPLNAGVDTPYSYTATATDPQSSAITYSISSQSNMSNLSINSTTGVVSWTPTTAEVGTQSITVTALDALGLRAVQTFNVNVVNSQPPTISSGSPPSTLTAGQTFVYQVQASDPAGDALSYSLIGAPTGMAIDSSGRITWPTTATNIGDYSYQVVVTNPYGLSVTSSSYTLDVTADTAKPTVQVEISSNPADQNSLVYFDVIASDNVGVTSIGLTVGGTPVVLGTNGQGVYTASTLGQLSVVATASDAAGNTGMADATLSVIDPTDTSAPVVSIASPGNSVVITSPTEVVGTVSDSHILSWTLSEAPQNSSTYTTIATGTSTVSDGDLGLFDPTTLADGAYTIELTAWNAGGHVSTTSITVNVTGYLKLGNLSLSFTDLSIPVAGIPIPITRSYNSLNANTVGDFGYGWTLSETDYQLNVNTQGNGLGSFSDYVPLEGGNRVVVTLPDGTEEGFTFEPQAVTDPFGLITEYYLPYFVPDPGVTDTLTVQPVDLSVIPGTNEYYGGDDDDDYNPAEAEFGGDYTLTNESGISTTFDATTGQVTSEADLHGNTLTFDSTGIYSNTGLAVTFTRDSKGRITQITDPNGNSILYGYDAAGDLVSVTDRDNNVTTLAYSAALPHFLTTITDGMGNSVLNVEYNSSGRITEITNGDGDTDSVSYDLSTLTTSTLAAGGTSPDVDTFNSEGLITQSVDALGNQINYTYNGMYLASKTQIVSGVPLTTYYTENSYGQVVSETDPSGATSYYSYDQYGDPESQTDALGDTTTLDYYYNPNAPVDQPDPMDGDMLSATDPLGSTTDFTYDDAGDVLTTTTDAGTPDATTTTNTYDQYGNLLTTTTPQGVTTTNTYDSDGNLLTSSWTWVNPTNSDDTEAMETVNTYDGNGNLTSTKTYENNVLQTTTSSTYDADNRVYSSTDDLGGVTTTVYDANGNVIQTTTPDGMVTDTVYNAQGQATYTDDPHLPGEPTNGTLTEYDQDGNVIGTETLANVVITVTKTGDVGTSVLTSVGAIVSTTSTDYDAAGLVSQVVDTSGTVTSYQYDRDGDPVEVQQTADGITRTTTSTFDALGRVTSTTDPLGLTTQYQYDADSDVTKTTFADGSSITDRYDSEGNLIAETDQNGVETQYVYNQYGELTEVIEPSVTNPTTGEPVNPTYTYGYDIYGDQTSMTDAEGNTTQYAYDPNGNMIQETLPMGQTESWQYNGVGELTSQTDFDGNVIDYEYNDLGETTQKTVYAYTNLTTPYEAVTYQHNVNYTAQGSYQDIVDDSLYSTPTTSTYDVNGNLVEIQSPQGTIYYTYDLATGEETGVSTSNTDTQYSYDQAGEMKSVTVTELQGATLSTPLITSYSYDLDGNLIQTRNANGTTETRTYSDVNELTSITDNGPFGVYASFTYTYDLAGHVLKETDLGGATDSYTYDSLYRLTGESMAVPGTVTRTLTWAYDLDGNRVASTDSGAPADQQSLSYSYNANGELTGLAGLSSYGQTYTYDADGNTLSVTGTGGASSASYTWDPQGRMTSATTDGSTVSYQYNDSGDRISETVNGQTTTFLNDPNQANDQVLEEYAEGGVLAATFIRGIDLLFEDQIQNGVGTLSYYATDNLESTRALTNSAGAVTNTYSYDAYGNLIASSGAAANPYLFTGEWFDAPTGQYYQRARYYEPVTGSFVSRDTYDGSITSPITENHYAYANADPANFVDPTGHEGDISEEITVSNISATFDGITQEAIQQAGIRAITTLTCMAVEDLAVQGVYVLVVAGLDGLPLGVYVGQSANIATRVNQWVAYWSKQNATAKLVRAFQVATNVSTTRAEKFVREYVEQTVLNAVSKVAASEGVNIINWNNPISPANLARRIATHLKGIARKTFSTVTKVLRIC